MDKNTDNTISNAVTTTGALKLTQVEVDYLQNYLDKNDRGGYYIALYNMTGVTQVLVEGQISTFSEALGSAAYTSNLLEYMIYPEYSKALAEYIAKDNRYVGRAPTLDTFSNIVAQTSLDKIKEFIDGHEIIITYDENGKESTVTPRDVDSTGYFDNKKMLDEAFTAWDRVGIRDFFPANLLLVANELKDRPGTVIAATIDKILNTLPSEITNAPPVYTQYEALKFFVEFYIENFSDKEFDSKVFWNAAFATGSGFAIVGALLGPFLGKELSDFEGRDGYKIIELSDASYKAAINIETGVVAGIFKYQVLPDTLPAILGMLAEHWPEIVGALAGGVTGALTANFIAELLKPMIIEYKNWLIDGVDGVRGIPGIEEVAYSNMPTPWDESKNSYVKVGTDMDDTIWGEGGIISPLHVDELHGGKGNDRIFSGDGDDHIYGEQGNDILYGQEGEDFLDGGDNDDILRGGADNDFLDGGSGDDQLDGGDITDKPSGNDTLIGGTGDDLLAGGDGNDILYGDTETTESLEGDGNDQLYGGKGVDNLYGGGGNDLIIGGDGDDVLYGGDGNDAIYGGNDNDKIAGGKGNDLIIGGAGVLVADGGEGNDFIIGDDFSDQVKGGAGNDIIWTKSGLINTVDGDDGNDILLGGNYRDDIYGGTGNDIINGYDGENNLSGGNGSNLIVGGKDKDTFIISEHGTNVAAGGEGIDAYGFFTTTIGSLSEWGFGTNLIHDKDGTIIIDGVTLAIGVYDQNLKAWKSTNDLYIIRKLGDDTDKTIISIHKIGDEKNTIYVDGWKNNGDMGLTFSTPPTENIPTTDGLPTLNDGNNVAYNQNKTNAGGGNDYIDGTNSADVLDGGSGNNYINGWDGNDLIKGGNNKDIILGGDGQDTIYGGAGDDVLLGSVGWKISPGLLATYLLNKYKANVDKDATLESLTNIIINNSKNNWNINFSFQPIFDEDPKSYNYYLVDNGVITTTILPKILINIITDGETLMCAEKTGGFNLVNYRHSSGVYHEQETEDLHRRI